MPRSWLVALLAALCVACADGSASTPRVGDGGAELPCACPAGERCADDGSCVSPCGDGPACVLGGLAQCCEPGTACQEGRCVAAPSPCTVGEDCEIDELCEPSAGACVPRASVRVCEFRPPVGDFEPTVGCRWAPPAAPPGATLDEVAIASMSEVVMTPAVANLTDDNDDGVTDARDTPDIVFVSFDHATDGCCTNRGVVRVVSGGCNADETMTTLATLKGLGAADWIDNSSGIALGNLHPEPLVEERAPEIVATFKNGGAIAWRRTANDGSVWEILWQNDELPTRDHTRGGAQPSIADLNADGRPEVIIGNVVLDGPTGRGPGDPDLPADALAWDGLDRETLSPGADLGIGNNAFLGPVSIVADLERDGFQEVIAGNTVYNYDGTERWTFPYATANSSCGGALDCDGYDAVGNFDQDADAEIVIIRLGELFILNHDGSPVPGIPLPIRIPGAPGDVEAPTYSPAGYLPNGPLYDELGNTLPPERILCGGALSLPAFDIDGAPVMSDGSQVVVRTAGANEGGPPTVADFDGDGFAEIGTASSTAYVVLDLQCTGEPLPAECEREWVRWMVANDDCSSRVTGSSVFDFEGDGFAEVIYADETKFRIFRGIDGAVLYEDDTHRSNTRLEMPIVVDVDNDGKSEMVVPEPNTDPTKGGIEIWEDAHNNWVRTRRIWNQHAYSVTNVTESGQIPRVPEPNWLGSRLNNFRQNVQPAGLFDAPDLVVREIVRLQCDVDRYAIAVVVGNDGALSVPPGILTHVVVTTSAGASFDLGALPTLGWLLPGQSEQLTAVFDVPEGLEIPTIVVSATVDDDGSGKQQYNECDDLNNASRSNPISCPVVR